MKILFVSTEFEARARGITGIIKSMVTASKESGHEVGVLVGYPKSEIPNHDLLNSKVEHLYLQHYFDTNQSLLYPNLHSKKVQLKVLANKAFDKSKEIKIQHGLITQKYNLAKKLDFVIKIPYIYKFMIHGLSPIAKLELKKAIKKYKIDLVITGSPTVLSKKDVGKAKLIQFVHDVMPIELMETPADNETPRKFAEQLLSASQADMVFVNSKDTASKVLQVNKSADIHILYGTSSSKASSFKDTSFLLRNNLEKDGYLLFISVLETRKNLKVLFDAYMKAYPKINIPLVIVGGEGFGYEAIVSHHQGLPDNIRNNIMLVGYVSEPDKYALLNNARAFVFPSLYEGIGLPILEAFASNLPVLTSNKGALPEAGGKAALYIEDPYNVNEVAEGIIKITKDDKLRIELRKHMKEQTDKFTQAKFNKRFISALANLED